MLKCFSEQQVERRECSTADTTHKQAPIATQVRAPKLQRKPDQKAPNWEFFTKS